LIAPFVLRRPGTSGEQVGGNTGHAGEPASAPASWGHLL